MSPAVELTLQLERERRVEAEKKRLFAVFYSLITLREAIKRLQSNSSDDISRLRVTHAADLVDVEMLEAIAIEFGFTDIRMASHIAVLEDYLTSRQSMGPAELVVIEHVILDISKLVAEMLEK